MRDVEDNMAAHRRNKPWLRSERIRCHELYNEGLSRDDIARELGRTPSGVGRRVEVDRVSRKIKKWTRTDEELVKRLWMRGVSGGDIAALTDRTRNSVMGKIRQLGLVGAERGRYP